MRQLLKASVLIAFTWASLARADNAYASVTTDDGTEYTFYRTDGGLSQTAAAAACNAAGGTLASLESAEQVRATVWSKAVVDSAAELSDPALLWTGFKISWKGAHHRRMLRSVGNDFILDDTDVALARLLSELEANPDAVPAATADGRAIPQLVRAHMLEREQAARRRGGRRALHGSADGGAAATSAFLQNAEISWADGADVDFVLANPSNLGFMACNRKKVSECCGAVFDIGPDAYPGSDFPSVFLYPCNSNQISGAMPPAGYMCAVSPTAELPGNGGSSPKPSPRPSPPPSAKVCKPGMQPVTSAGHTQCKRCKPNTYSADGLTCKKCPAGKKSAKGAAQCK